MKINRLQKKHIFSRKKFGSCKKKLLSLQSQKGNKILLST